MPSPQTITQASIGYGISISILNDASPNVYVEFAGVRNITPPNSEVDQVDVTHYQSPRRTKEYIAGLIGPGSASIEVNYVAGSATDIRIRAIRDSRSYKTMRITFSNGEIWEFLASITGYEVLPPKDDVMTATAQLKLYGSITTISPLSGSLLLEDGTGLLLEDGSSVLLEG